MKKTIFPLHSSSNLTSFSLFDLLLLPKFFKIEVYVKTLTYSLIFPKSFFIMAMDQNGEIKDLSDNDVWFKFNPNGTYEYSTNNSYRESGHYRMRAKVLYTTDTISNASIEKAVRLAVINNDSIHFEMNSKGVAQTLQLTRLN